VPPPGEAFVVTTAPTTAQVEAILWRYIGAAHRRAELPGRVTLDAKWHIGQQLVGDCRKPADYDQAAFQGIHARYVLVIIDEADGVRSRSSTRSTPWRPISMRGWWRSGIPTTRPPISPPSASPVRAGR
jgi:hypothetical protein